MDNIQIATAVVTLLAPFLPFLIEVGKVSSKKFAETVAAKGGEAAWKKASELWNDLQSQFEEDHEFNSACTMVATKPEDEVRRMILIEVVNGRIEENPGLAHIFFNRLGGQESIQEVLVNQGSLIENVSQRLRGGGRQTVSASEDSTIRGVQQIKD